MELFGNHDLLGNVFSHVLATCFSRRSFCTLSTSSLQTPGRDDGSPPSLTRAFMDTGDIIPVASVRQSGRSGLPVCIPSVIINEESNVQQMNPRPATLASVAL